MLDRESADRKKFRDVSFFKRLFKSACLCFGYDVIAFRDAFGSDGAVRKKDTYALLS